MNNLIKNIEQWANDRNIINGSTPQKQMLKLMEEFGELVAGHNKNDMEFIKDSIGDCVVVLTIIQKQLNGKNLHFIYDIEKSAGLGEKNAEYYLFCISTALGKSSYFALKNDKRALLHYLEEIWIGLIRYSTLKGLDFKECVQHAYDQIKDRKGKMIDGVFVKEGEL